MSLHKSRILLLNGIPQCIQRSICQLAFKFINIRTRQELHELLKMASPGEMSTHISRIREWIAYGGQSANRLWKYLKHEGKARAAGAGRQPRWQFPAQPMPNCRSARGEICMENRGGKWDSPRSPGRSRLHGTSPQPSIIYTTGKVTNSPVSDITINVT